MKISRFPFRVFWYLLLLILANCSVRSRSEKALPQSGQSPESGAKQRAIDTALLYAEETFGWRTIDVGTVKFINQEWWVDLAEVPLRIGSFATIVISSEGKVVRFLPGN